MSMMSCSSVFIAIGHQSSIKGCIAMNRLVRCQLASCSIKSFTGASGIRTIGTSVTRTWGHTALYRRLTTKAMSRGWQSVRQGFLVSRMPLKIPESGARTFATLALISPLTFFRGKFQKNLDPQESNLSEEILAHIPKEVFKKDVLIKKKTKRNWLMRALMAAFRSIRYSLRVVRILFTFGPIFSLYPLTYIKKDFLTTWWRLLLWACEYTGPTFIKLGQWASTRRDLFPAEFCDMFSRLHHATRVHSWFATKYKLRNSFGKRWREILVKIEKKPIGSGCIAQVHRAWMRADMVPDESIVEEVLSSLDDTDEVAHDVEFAEGLEILGFGVVMDAKENIEEYIMDKRSDWRSSGKKGTELVDIKSPQAQLANPPNVPAGVTTTDSDNALSPGGRKDMPAGGTYPLVDVNVISSIDELPEDPPPLPPPPPQPDGEATIPVAVKVLHPGIYRSVSRDLSILRTLAWTMEKIMPSLRWLSLTECMLEFTDLMTRQIDLRFEAECLEQFVENFEDNPNIRFPRPIQPYCKRNVLVETYEEGEHISKYLHGDGGDDPEGLKELLAMYGIDALLQMVFVDNLVHGDLHPGNILVQNAQYYTPQEENKLVLVDICDTVVVNVKPAENPVRLVMLDAGITTSLSEQHLRNFKSVFTAVVIGEGERVAELMLENATHNECKDIHRFKSELKELVNKYREQTIKLGRVKMGDLLSEVFSVMSRHKVKMESNFASTVLAIFVLEGLGQSLHPELDILEKAKPILLGHT